MVVRVIYADTPLWERLPLTQKLRLLVEERLKNIEQSKTKKAK